MVRITQTTAALVLEQDFVLQIRRLQKLGTEHYVINILFSQMAAMHAHDLLDATQDKLNAFAGSCGGALYLMTNDDAFLVLPQAIAKDPTTFAAALLIEILPEGFDPGRSSIGLTNIFRMPGDYMPLRERVNYYIDIAKEIEANVSDDPERNLQASNVQGPLTAYALSQIERMLDDMDIYQYARAQYVMEHQGDTWSQYYEENFVSLTDMQRDKFPRLEMQASSRLFVELGSVLDRRMLAHMIKHEGWQNRKIGLNLAARTVLSSTFAQFCHIVQGAARGLVTFEINISDLFNDLPQFKSALEMLKQEGFRVAIDGVRPDTLPMLRLETLPIDELKISVSKKAAASLVDIEVLGALRKINPAQVIFMHVENAETVQIGASLGVTKYQGFYIDELVGA